MDIYNIEEELNGYNEYVCAKLKSGEDIGMLELAQKFTNTCLIVSKLNCLFQDCLKTGDNIAITKVSELQKLASSVSSKFDIIASQL